MKRLKCKTIRVHRKRDILINCLLVWLILQLAPPQGISQISPTIQKIVWPGYGDKVAYIIFAIGGILTLFLRRRYEQELIVALLFPLVAGVLTILQGLSISGWLRNYSGAIIALFLVIICKQNLPRLLRLVRLYLGILILINMIFIILYPTGAYKSSVYSYYNWFLGYKSSLQCYIVPYTCLGWLESRYSKRNVQFFVMLAVCVVESFLSHNTMLSVGMLLFTLYVALHLYNVRSLQNGYLYLAIVTVVNVLFIFFITWLGRMQLFQLFLTAFSKNLSISSRATIIWPKALQLIADNPIFGHGVYPAAEYVRIFGGSGYVHAHNQMLQVLLDGGVLLTGIFFAWLLYVCHRLGKYKELESSKVFLFFFFLILFLSTVEVYIYGPIYFMTWLILYLSMYVNDLDRQYQNLYQSA